MYNEPLKRVVQILNNIIKLLSLTHRFERASLIPVMDDRGGHFLRESVNALQLEHVSFVHIDQLATFQIGPRIVASQAVHTGRPRSVHALVHANLGAYLLQFEGAHPGHQRQILDLFVPSNGLPVLHDCLSQLSCDARKRH